MLGDAVSHAILPGLAVAFMVSGSRDPFIMLLGALAAGLCTTFISSLLHRSRLVAEDSSMGIVFTTFFAIGVILISWVARQIDLDHGCVLYGLAEFTPFDTVTIADVELPRSFVWLSCILVMNAVFVICFFKELKLSTFDPALSTSLGFNPGVIHYALMTSVTLTAVASFEAVGSILVVSMLITPAAAAYLLSDRLRNVLIIAALLGVLSSVFGYLGALSLNTSVAGMMSVSAGALFILSAIFAPKHGFLRKIFHRTLLRFRIVRDDLLGMLFRWHEVVGSGSAAPLRRKDVTAALGTTPITYLAAWSLRASGDLVTLKDGTLRLTEAGLVDGAALVRSHRLWETYLAHHLGLPLDHLHTPSERTEHFIGRAIARDIEKEVSSESDPHGRSIPRS